MGTRRSRAGGIGSSLGYRNYRLFFFGQIVSVMGTWMQTVAQSFLVLDLTHSETDLGLVTAARFLPILLLGPAGGLFADRHDKRRILYVTQALSGVLAAIYAILTGTHVIQMWLVYVLALSLAFVNVFDNPARQSFVSEMVPPGDVPNAVTLNSVSINLARVFGAAAGGVLFAVLGLALCFACNAISFAAVILSLAAMNAALLYPTKAVNREPGQIRQGLRYVRETPELLIPLLMIALVGTLAWEFQVTLPLMASRVFGGGAGSYGVMASVMGIGAVGGGLVSAARSGTGRCHRGLHRFRRGFFHRRPPVLHRGRPGGPQARSLCVSGIGWGVAITAAAVAPTLPLELAALVFVGYGSITFNSDAKTTLQLAADPAMRGRVMALWALAWLGSTTIGGPLIGWIAQEFGARCSLAAGGLPTLACALLALPALTRIEQKAGA